MQLAWKFEGRLPELGSELIADITETMQHVRILSKRRHLASNDKMRSVGAQTVIDCVVETRGFKQSARHAVLSPVTMRPSRPL